MLEVIAAIVLMLIVLLALISIPFIPSSRTLFEETQELRKAGAALVDGIVHELRLDWLCEKLNCLILAAQKAMSDALDWNRTCREIDDMGIEIRKPTFNDYLREAHGIGSQEKKGER
jgi:hypothetical protein